MLPQNEIAEIDALLPFYINGTLGELDKARVEAALEGSHELRVELEAATSLNKVVKDGSSSILADLGPSDARLNHLLEQIDQMPPHSEAVSTAQAQTRAGIGQLPKPSLFGFLAPQHWHPAVSLALAVAFLFQGGLTYSLYTKESANKSQIMALEKQIGGLEFQLASGPGSQAQPSILLEVDAKAPWAEVLELLTKEGLSIVSGPSDSVISVSSSAKDEALDALIGRLGNSPLVVSAEKAA